MARRLTGHTMIRSDPRQVAVWCVAAERAEISLSELLRRAADAYSRRILVEETRPNLAQEDDPSRDLRARLNQAIGELADRLEAGK